MLAFSGIAACESGARLDGESCQIVWMYGAAQNGLRPNDISHATDTFPRIYPDSASLCVFAATSLSETMPASF